MANLVRNWKFLRPTLTLFRHERGCSTLGATSLMERVQHRIDTKRQQALEGGGKHRIEAQHKRVSMSNEFGSKTSFTITATSPGGNFFFFVHELSDFSEKI